MTSKLGTQHLIFFCLLAILLTVCTVRSDAEQYVGATPPEVNTEGLKQQKQIEMLYSDAEVTACAQLIYGEYGADWVSDSEKAKIVCTVVNRTHSDEWISYVGSDELMAQLTSPEQFYYRSWFLVTDRHYRIAYDVLWRASQIAQGCEGIAWETDTLHYSGNGWTNNFY